MHRPDPKDKSDLANEERSEATFAAECAERLLGWLNLTAEEARVFVNGEGKYYSGGHEEIEIPARVEGSDDPIFPPLHEDVE